MTRRHSISATAGRQVRLYFTPLANFEADGSAYVAGMFYTVSTPDLERRARVWEREGKVKFLSGLPRSAARATVHGTMETL